MVRHQEDHAPQRGIIGGSTPHQAWLVAPSRAHTENLRTVERSIKMHKERLGAIGRLRGCRAYPTLCGGVSWLNRSRSLSHSSH